MGEKGEQEKLRQAIVNKAMARVRHRKPTPQPAGEAERMRALFTERQQEVEAIRERAASDYRHEPGEQYTPMLRDLRFLLGELNVATEFWNSAEKELKEVCATPPATAPSAATLCACGHHKSQHEAYLDHDECLGCWGLDEPCSDFRPAYVTTPTDTAERARRAADATYEYFTTRRGGRTRLQIVGEMADIIAAEFGGDGNKS